MPPTGQPHRPREPLGHCGPRQDRRQDSAPSRYLEPDRETAQSRPGGEDGFSCVRLLRSVSEYEVDKALANGREASTATSPLVLLAGDFLQPIDALAIENGDVGHRCGWRR